jgi:hypothetical protein
VLTDLSKDEANDQKISNILYQMYYNKIFGMQISGMQAALEPCTSKAFFDQSGHSNNNNQCFSFLNIVYI